MKIWIIKHQGKNWWGNLCTDSEAIFADESRIGMGRYFTRKKDAVKFRKGHYSTNPYLEVVWAELQESKQDNRKRL